MARQVLTIQKIGRDNSGGNPSIVPSTVAADDVNGDIFDNAVASAIGIRWENTTGSPIVATVITTGTVEGEDIPDKTYTVGANDNLEAGGFNSNYEALDGASGIVRGVAIDYAVTGINVRIFSVTT